MESATLKQAGALRFFRARATLLSLLARTSTWNDADRSEFVAASLIFHSSKRFVPRRAWALPRPNSRLPRPVVPSPDAPSL